MSIVKRAIKNLLFGDTLLPQEFTIGMVEPNSEVTVWFDGMGDPVDVTRRYATACSDPLTFCIAFDGIGYAKERGARLSLRFSERHAENRTLGEISLREGERISLPGMELVLFQARSSANYCLPATRLTAHYLLQAYSLWRGNNASGMRMSLLDRRAAIVSFIRPHPVMLVSVAEGSGGNVFPMNLMGELGPGRLAFALKASRRAAPLVERVGRAALSNIPVSQASFAFRLASNHFKDSIAWDDLPFDTKRSTMFDIPIPAFASRVREVAIQRVHPIGSHTLFVARLEHDERVARTADLCVIHGFYQAWRLRNSKSELAGSVVEDSLHKGLHAAAGSQNTA